jgi:endo-1,4-beta-mannosidase
VLTFAPSGLTALRRRALTALALLAALVALAIQVAPSLADESAGSFSEAGTLDGVVKAHDGAFATDAQPWQSVGYNDYRLTAAPGGYVCDTSYGEVSDDQLAARLDRAAASGATVIRTWFFQSFWDPDGDGSGDYSAFDRVLAAAAERGLRVVPVIANHWGDCEAGTQTKDLDFYAGGFREPFAGDALSYLDYAGELASRYAGSPAVAYWQLVNEPEASSGGACDEAAAAAALGGFAAEAAETIRTADPDHLISLGTIGGGQCGSAGDDYLAVHSALDVCEIHVYDGSETGTSPTTTLPGDSTNGVAARISACEGSGKPIVAGELGFAADLDSSGNPSGTVSSETLANRARFLAARVDAMGELGLDGFMVWQLDSRAPLSDQADTYAVGPCDPIEGVIAEATGSDPAALISDGCEAAAAPAQS